jgi:hypothetical protein
MPKFDIVAANTATLGLSLTVLVVAALELSDYKI